MGNSGYSRDDMVFIPFSSKNNWIETYPSAHVTMDVEDDGLLVVPIVMNTTSIPAASSKGYSGTSTGGMGIGGSGELYK